MADFLIAYHIPANTGFAIEPLEIAFYHAVADLLGSTGRIHLGYTGFPKGKPRWLDGEDEVPLVELSYRDLSSDKAASLEQYLKSNNIRYVLAFDLPVGADICGVFRRAAVQQVFSYWGAPMSSINSGPKLLAKRLQVALTRNKPNHFIFESYGMQRAAVEGRGVSPANTSVVRLGIDVEKFTTPTNKSYVYEQFAIPPQRKILFYAGHMEERKGVRVIVQAAAELVNQQGITDVHFLICGDREGEKSVFDKFYRGTAAENHITFAGYRDDIPQLMPGCYAGIIASTGWDSFPRSSLEMSAAGLPLFVSDLLGLNETVVDGETGLLFEIANHGQLAQRIAFLLENPEQREIYSTNAIARVRKGFTLKIQHQKLLELLTAHIGSVQ